jgi:hypothetical protein
MEKVYEFLAKYEYLFSLKRDNWQYLEESTIPDELRKAFEDKKQPLSNEIKILNLDEKCCEIIDGTRRYRIERTATGLNIYNFDKVPEATVEDYLQLCGKIRHTKDIDRAIKKLLDLDFIKRRGGKGKYEYCTNEEYGELFIKTEHADSIIRCPMNGISVWNNEIMLYDFTVGNLIKDEVIKVHNDYERQCKERLEDIIRNFKAIWRWVYRMSRNGKKIPPIKEEDSPPRIIIVLDFNPKSR